MHNALGHPHIADDLDNIYPATRNEHFIDDTAGIGKTIHMEHQITIHIPRTYKVTNIAIKFSEDKSALASFPAGC